MKAKIADFRFVEFYQMLIKRYVKNILKRIHESVEG